MGTGRAGVQRWSVSLLGPLALLSPLQLVFFYYWKGRKGEKGRGEWVERERERTQNQLLNFIVLMHTPQTCVYTGVCACRPALVHVTTRADMRVHTSAHPHAHTHAHTHTCALYIRSTDHSQCSEVLWRSAGRDRQSVCVCVAGVGVSAPPLYPQPPLLPPVPAEGLC